MSFAEKFASKVSSTGGMVAKITREKSIVYHLQPKQGNETAYIIIEIDQTKHEAFQKDYQQAYEAKGNLELTDYGTVLHSGWGEPPNKIKAEMREKFGLFE